MQTPLIFKLLLLLAFALRLLKMNKKTVDLSSKKYFIVEFATDRSKADLTDGEINGSANDAIKSAYRRYIRKNENRLININEFQLLNTHNQLICVAYQFAKFYEKGGFYRFLWHGNEWLIAFGQSLEVIGHKQSSHYKKLVSEIAGFDVSDFDYELIDWNSVYPFPDANQTYQNFDKFEKDFDVEIYLSAILKRIN